jgi:hypothetical protein
VRQDELLHRSLRAHPPVSDLLGSAEIFDALQELTEALAISA